MNNVELFSFAEFTYKSNLYTILIEKLHEEQSRCTDFLASQFNRTSHCGTPRTHIVGVEKMDCNLNKIIITLTYCGEN